MEGEIAGFKLGYEQDEKIFYSWLGGIIPDFRMLGLERQLLQAQENWAKQQGYRHIKVNTLNRFSSILNMLISNQYLIKNIQQDTDK